MGKEIKYYSTNRRSPEVSFREALLRGLAPDGGLYMPSSIPRLCMDEMETYAVREYYEIAFSVMKSFLVDEIGNQDLMTLCKDAYNFSIPLENVSDKQYVMRLDQGPTASFKDFAARMMARLMNHFISSENSHYTILTATSGDTGSAVASAFHGLSSIDVIILFPFREVSEIQRKQMTTLKGNIRVVAIDGKFDDCQMLVKKAFMDPSLSNIPLTSANSINIGRLLPQAIYYFYCWSRLNGNQLIFSVPSGNYGNLMGGIIAREMGLPVKRFIISTNENNEVPEYLKTGRYKTISPSINCISSAMNVGHPSNLARIIALYGGIMNESGEMSKSPDLTRMQNDFFGVSVSDEITRETIACCYEKYRLLLEPHGAVAWKGLEYYLENEPPGESENNLYVSLETAHPAKFPDEILRILNLTPEPPDSIINLSNLDEGYQNLINDYNLFRKYIRENS